MSAFSVLLSLGVKFVSSFHKNTVFTHSGKFLHILVTDVKLMIIEVSYTGKYPVGASLNISNRRLQSIIHNA